MFFDAKSPHKIALSAGQAKMIKPGGKVSLKPLLALALLVPFIAPASGARAERPLIDGAFELLPAIASEGFRHTTGIIHRDEFIWFGGLGNAGPSTAPVNYDVQTLDLDDPQAWQYRSTDVVVPEPWFTSTHGFVELDSGHYLACEDTDADLIFSFDPESYQFSHVSTSPFPPTQQASDCCAVGVTIPNNRGGTKDEERIYLIGGGNGFAEPLNLVRYYSVTNDEWVIVDSLDEARSHLGCAAAELRGENYLYAIAGNNRPLGQTLRSIEVYNVQDDEWKHYPDYFADGEGRTRVAVQNLEDQYLFLIGGDSTCAGGSACPADQPLTTVELIDLLHGNKLLSHNDYDIPQLTTGRHSPATALRHLRGNRYELYVVSGRNRSGGGLQVLTSSEVLSFDRVNREGLAVKSRFNRRGRR